MEIRIKNQLPGTVDFCIGQHEYQLEPEQDVIAPVKDGDCMYLDQLVYARMQTPAASKALAKIDLIKHGYRAGILTSAEVITKVRAVVKSYLEDTPIPYSLTDKVGGTDD